MKTATVEIDKTYATLFAEELGTIVIRAVILAKKAKKDGRESPSDSLELPSDLESDEPFPIDDNSPLNSYLETPKHGKGYAVFLINGQRHHTWDNTFIVRDLNFKYLRSRTMIIIDLDGLVPEAIGEIIQGSRQGFFEGRVYHAIRDRVVATLKNDPDIEHLEEQAEQEISDLRSGDDAVKETLNQLIDDHHTFATQTDEGAAQSGIDGKAIVEAWGPDRKQEVVVQTDPTVGDPSLGPVLVAEPTWASMRLRPGESKVIRVGALPSTAWDSMRGPLHVDIPDPFEGLKWRITSHASGADITLTYTEPEDFDDDQYPVDADMRIVARFDGVPELRLIHKRIIASDPSPPSPRPKPPLVDPPTLLKVSSRQPVRLVVNGPDTHVRLRWNGKDSLAIGSPPVWTFTGRCLTNPSFAPVTFSKPNDGRFSMLIPTPNGLPVGQQLVFEVEANGAGGARLAATFTTQVVEPPEPRRVKAKVPDSTAQRRPPYELKIVTRDEWEGGSRWAKYDWTEADAGCFIEPTPTKPLVLMINEHLGILEKYKESLTKRDKNKLEERTVKERMTRYTSHVAFHLYQMYLASKRLPERPADEGATEPTDEQKQQEANRVAATLIRLMEITR